MQRISSFSSRLKSRREELDWTQEYLAHKIQSWKTSISHWERDERIPSLEAALQLSEALNVSPLWLFGYDVPQDPHSLDYLSE